MAIEPLLAAAPSGDLLELRPSGSWTAANVVTLERLADAVTPQLDRSNLVRVNMAEVRELDTLGAWMLEKLSRRATSAGHRMEVIGVADNYAGLIEEVRQVNRHNPAPAPARNPVVVKVEEIGRSAVGATEDLTVFLQMLGSIFLAIFGLLRRPKSLRLTSLVYQLYKVGWQAIPIVVLITFLIGAIIAQQGIFHFRKFGANSYVVDMVGILVHARTRRVDRRDHGRRPFRQRLHRRAWLDEDARGNRRALDHGPRPVEVLILPRVVALILRVADPGLHRLDRRALRRRSGGVVLRRHESGDLHRPAA